MRDTAASSTTVEYAQGRLIHPSNTVFSSPLSIYPFDFPALSVFQAGYSVGGQLLREVFGGGGVVSEEGVIEVVVKEEGAAEGDGGVFG